MAVVAAAESRVTRTTRIPDRPVRVRLDQLDQDQYSAILRYGGRPLRPRAQVPLGRQERLQRPGHAGRVDAEETCLGAPRGTRLRGRQRQGGQGRGRRGPVRS